MQLDVTGLFPSQSEFLYFTNYSGPYVMTIFTFLFVAVNVQETDRETENRQIIINIKTVRNKHTYKRLPVSLQYSKITIL